MSAIFYCTRWLLGHKKTKAQAAAYIVLSLWHDDVRHCETGRAIWKSRTNQLLVNCLCEFTSSYYIERYIKSYPTIPITLVIEFCQTKLWYDSDSDFFVVFINIASIRPRITMELGYSVLIVKWMYISASFILFKLLRDFVTWTNRTKKKTCEITLLGLTDVECCPPEAMCDQKHLVSIDCKKYRRGEVYRINGL